MIPQRLDVDHKGRRTVYVLRPDLSEPGGATAWYEPEGGGEAAEATGAVWVRFREGERAEERTADLERAGYRIERVPAYAPHAAFVRAANLGASLAGIETLRAIDGVEHVEPELRRRMSYR